MRTTDKHGARGRRFGRILLLMVAVAGAVATASPVRAQGEGQSGAITPTAVPFDEAQELLRTAAIDDLVVRSSKSRFVRLSTEEVDAQLSAGAIEIQLDADTVASFTVAESTTGASGFSIYNLRNVDTDETATIVRRDDVVSMTLKLASGRWHLTPVFDGIQLVTKEARAAETITARAARRAVAPAPEIDVLPAGVARHVVERFASEDGIRTVVTSGALAAEPIAQAPVDTRTLAAGPNSTVIDVMIWYDNPTVTFYGSSVAAEAAIVTSIGAANTAFLTSDIDVTLAISELSHVDFDGTGTSANDLSSLRSKYDGVLDDAHTTRDSTNSDLVTLVSVLTDGFCGRADLLQQLPSIATEDQAFSIVHAGCLTNDTYAHEVGHNMGAAHDDANTFGSNGVFATSRGYVDTINQFVTVMSYRNSANGCLGCARANQFSSTTETWMGFPTGDVDHDNAGTLDQTRMGIAAYRPSPCPPPSNDDYPVRELLPSTSLTSTVGTNVCATVENLETYFIGAEPVQSVWYEWTAPMDGTATFSTCAAATDFDTELTVYDDAALFAGLMVLAHNDDAGAGCAVDPTHSIVSIPVAEGTAYRFKVDGSAAATGAFELTVELDALCNNLPVTIYLDRGESGTAANDVILGTAAGEVISGLGGDDTICGLGGADTITADGGLDTIYGGGGADIIHGGDEADVIFGGSGDDVIHGDAGGDTIAGNAGADTIYGGADADTIFGGDDADTIHGGLGDDNIQGNDGVDVLNGDAGQDTLSGNDGDDTLNGGADNDTLYGVAGVDTINGDGGADTILGGLNADIINGGDGDDLISGNAGADTINGDADNDTLYGSTDGDLINGGTGMDTILGGTGNDELNGGPDRDLISGTENDDTINGGDGDDDLFGVNGVDTINGDAGVDLILGGNGNDIINGGTDGDLISGNSGADTIDGGDGNDEIYGVTGEDTLTGGAGEDIILGGPDNDTINSNGDGSVDQISGNAGTDTCNTDPTDNVFLCELP